MLSVSAYRDPMVRPIDPEIVWQALDGALESAMGDPDWAASLARWCWEDARRLGMPDVEAAAAALLDVLFPT